MKILWDERGWDDYLHWQRSDAKLAERINEMIKDIRRDPFVGIGKAEPLRNEMSGWWSRRINREHRLVYRVIGKGDAQAAEIVQCRFHYGA